MERWIADTVGRMHIHKITNIDVARYMGVSPQYLSEILNGKRSPKGIRDRIEAAVDALIEQKSDCG